MAILKDRRFVPGTTGWTVNDLDDPEIEGLWFENSYEIVEGVLALRPAKTLDEAFAIIHLLFILEDRIGHGFAAGVDVILKPNRLTVVDAIYLSAEDREAQKCAYAATGQRKQLKYGRILIAPTLIIESITPGQESHDRETKRRWYAEAGVPNYWMLDALARTLESLILEGNDYRVDQSGKDDAELRPSMFSGLVIPLGKIWEE